MKRKKYFQYLFVILSFLFSFCNSADSDFREITSELDGLKVPSGFMIERVADTQLMRYPMFASFDNQGRLFVCESDGSSPSTEDMLNKPPYHISLLEDTDGDGVFDKRKIFADSLTYPKGAVFYKGSLYVSSAPDLFRLTDTDDDGVADQREVILTGWVFHHNGALMGGPFFGPDGWMYITDARRSFDITTKEGEKLKGNSTRIWRCRPDGTGLEPMCGGGYDNAIELAFMPSGETIGTMTYFIEPQGGMRDAIMHWVEGGVYPKPYHVIEQDQLKLTGDLMPVMTKMARVAPSGIMRYRGTAFGKEYHGNLFSAEFNTGRIMRHLISADGSTYKTIDEPFITSTSSDIHLTDVLEDADGSLLVLNTGGWFISGCPLSRVAKPDVKGGIYRIRKTGAEKIKDAWGRKTELRSLSPENREKYLLDPRLAVRDNAIEHLVETGDPAIAFLNNSLLRSENEEIRSAGVFALSRINTTNAWNEVIRSLDDTNDMVRTAASRVLGLAKNIKAVDKLIELVQKDKPQVRRQAATALGQIGEVRALNALLNAATANNDRFTEHAIIFALIQLKDTAALFKALGHSSPNVRKTAVIALDQMAGMPLRKEHLIPFLESDDQLLLNTGIWVAAHHREWPDVVIGFLQNHLNNSAVTGSDRMAIRDLMITFSSDNQFQHFLSDQLGNSSTDKERRTLLLDVIGRSSAKEIPGAWIHQLGKLLQDGNPETRLQVLTLIESRQIRTLNDQLNRIIQNTVIPADTRLKALNSRLLSDPSLKVPEYQMIRQFLGSNNESPIRQQAVRVLAKARLSKDQLISLAREELVNTDIFLIPGLVTAFEKTDDVVTGEALVTALKSSPDRIENLSEAELQKLLSRYPQTVIKAAEPLVVKLREKNAARLSQLQSVEASLRRGDVGRGRLIFYGKATCSSCHAITNEGGNFGPDLTNIGQIRSRHDILEAILFPDASFAREHETFKVNTKTATYSGIIREQLPDAIVLVTGPGQFVRVPRSEINSIEPQSISMMPPGLDKLLTVGELSDLMAYLVSLPDGLGGMKAEH